MAIKEGGFAPPPRTSRNTFQVFVTPLVVMVESKLIPEGLGFSQETARNASRMAALELYRLPGLVTEKYSKNRQKLGDFNESNLQEVLTVDEDTCFDVLYKLIKLGAGLRSELSKQVEIALQGLGFFKNGEEEEPFLTFTECDKHGKPQAPVLWEIMYEGSRLAEPDWRQFWGFRIPITHGISENRTDEIRIRQTFSAINEELIYSSREVAGLVTTIIPGLPSWSLHEAFQEHVEKSLKQNITTCENIFWLKNYLDQLYENTSSRQFQAELWKNRVLAYVFTNSQRRYDLLHFACHCKSDKMTELYTELQMKVGGEPLSLDVSFLSTECRRQSKWNYDDPGSLVFLNACSTGATNSSYEPPGFPDKWIACQGANAVIVTLCPVPDYFACAFAQKFYEILFQGIAKSNSEKPVAEKYVSSALLATRRYFMETYNNPLGLAYILYAVKGAQVMVDFEPFRGAA